MATGEIVTPSSSVSIGGANGLTHTRTRVGNGWRHNYMISLEMESGNPNAAINWGGTRKTFTWNGTVYAADQGTGETIAHNWSTGTHTYTSRDGTQIVFKESYVNNGESYYGTADALAETITSPDGKQTTLHYVNDLYAFEVSPGTFVDVYVVRLQSVTNNASYQLRFKYAADSASNTNLWYRITKVTAINNAEEYCDPTGACTPSNGWPSLSYDVSYSGSDTLETVTDVLGRTSRFRSDSSDRLTGVKRPSETTDGVVISYDGNDRVSSIQYQGSYTRTYTWDVLGSSLTSNSNDSLGRFRATATDSTQSVVTYILDAQNNARTYEYDADGRLEASVQPEGQRTEYTYDARGNVTEVRQIAEPGSGLADIVSTAAFPVSCANPVTCNKPISTTSAGSATSNYFYDATHGGITRIESPPNNDGDRTITHISYVSRTAKTRNSSGALVNQTTSLTLPSNVRACRTQELCPNSADEANTDIAYDANIAPNLNPVSVTRRAGNNTLVSTTSFSYTELGDVETINGPLAGNGDVTTYRRDNAGQVLGVISPDPDGAGSLQRPATRLTYNPDGQVTLSESGYVTGTSNTDWNNFTVDTVAETTYDDFGRAIASSQISTDGTTRYSITQYGYDNAGRLECTAVRMNLTSSSTALPADACVKMTPGTFGEDRIAKRYFDTADRVTEVWAGVDTSYQQQSAAMSYNANGTLAWVEDAADNRTSYTYDGHDRLSRTNYPSETVSSTSNNSDYEQLNYDAAGNVSTRRTRRGEVFGYYYAPNGELYRKIVPDRPGLSSTHTRDVFYKYDLFGNPTDARFDSLSGEGITFAYDALGRLTSEAQAMDGTMRQIGYQYDVASRQSRITHPDGEYWTYTYDNLGRFRTIRDENNVGLVGQYYDNAGRKGLRSRINGPMGEYYYYDDAGRLDRIWFYNQYSSTYHTNFYFSYNPAGEVISEDVTNQAYVWDAHPSGSLDTAYVPDGLNQYDSVDATVFSYDDNGNLISDGGTSFVYDTENRLVSASGGNNATLRYDPLGRLYEITDGSSNVTRMLYSGNDLIAEYNASGAMLDRYIHGLSAGDDPLIRYPGSNAATTASEHLYIDRLGSIIAIFGHDRTLKSINAYDEYGMPGAPSTNANSGRFRYTGQIWIPELGQYHYKARAYSPGLGRFMQTDPIGYGDGLNMYGYVGNNPTNFIDPLGLNGTSCPPGHICVDRDRKKRGSGGSDSDSGIPSTSYDPTLDPLLSLIYGPNGHLNEIIARGGGSGRQPRSKKRAPLGTSFVSIQITSEICRALAEGDDLTQLASLLIGSYAGYKIGEVLGNGVTGSLNHVDKKFRPVVNNKYIPPSARRIANARRGGVIGGGTVLTLQLAFSDEIDSFYGQLADACVNALS
ncbi:RHS repeat-associated core domain-containing protein [Erythrobacter sp. GH1-10]|uniref:RHS repeat-associated core domain-containing protein n=1 Tax=Erythrobacter sp. GH1-10 TaxID=3349334 RepID=UPI003877A238